MFEQLLRTGIERILRNRTILRKLPPEFNSTSLYLSPDAKLSYLKPGYSGLDLSLLNIARTYISKDTTVWDIGANAGVFTFAAASIAKKGSVLAVEADIWLAQLIKKSCSLPRNSTLNINVLPAAISEKCGISRFNIAARGRASSFLVEAGGRTQTGGTRERVYVPTLTLDSLLGPFSRPKFVKIDVEGAEALVVRGAEMLFSYVRPFVYIEISEENAQEVSGFFMRKGYLAVDPLKRVLLKTAAFNTLYFPEECLRDEIAGGRVTV